MFKKARNSWHGPCNSGGNFNITMNNSLIKNLAFNFTIGALAFAAFTYIDINIEAALSLFAAAGLVGIMLRDYRKPASRTEPALRAIPVKPVACHRRVAALVAA